MPQNPKFMEKSKLLKREEIFRLTRALVGFGIDEIRLTGGEPTLRHDFLDIVNDLSTLEFSKFGFTTNGLHLEKHLPELRKTKINNINFSLDSLNKFGFQKMTGSPHLEKVLESIFMAKELGFKVKLNAVLMKGVNDREVNDFMDFSARYDIEVRFLELMRIGEARESFDKYFISAGEVINRLEKESVLKQVKRPIDSTSFNYELENGAQVGFIASESRPFCGGCSRLRLSPEGSLRPCLMKSEGFSLVDKCEDEILELLYKTMALKPTDRIYDVSEPMNQIGG